MSRIAVLGAGAFGTALAIALSRGGTRVDLWGRDAAAMADMSASRRNARYLPDAELPASLHCQSGPLPADAGAVLIALPAQTVGPFLDRHAQELAGRTLVLCCKGVDLETGMTPSALARLRVPGAKVAVLTGPSFAVEIAAGLPTALTLACERGIDGAALQETLSRDTLRLYLGSDMLGAELGGALKNVIAIAAGIVIGAGLGDSARAALIARGFAEMTRVATALGAGQATLTGLSGLGDLVLTAMSEKSRNFRAGLALGEGRSVPGEVTVEGLATAAAVVNLAAKHDYDVPVTETVAEVAAGRLNVAAARDRLLARPLRQE